MSLGTFGSHHSLFHTGCRMTGFERLSIRILKFVSLCVFRIFLENKGWVLLVLKWVPRQSSRKICAEFKWNCISALREGTESIRKLLFPRAVRKLYFVIGRIGLWVIFRKDTTKRPRRKTYRFASCQGNFFLKGIRRNVENVHRGKTGMVNQPEELILYQSKEHKPKLWDIVAFWIKSIQNL